MWGRSSDRSVDWESGTLGVSWCCFTSAFHKDRSSENFREFADDPEKCEYFVRVKWFDNVPSDQAIHETGFFGQQNSVCKPRTTKWRHTVDQLKVHFPHWDD